LPHQSASCFPHSERNPNNSTKDSSLEPCIIRGHKSLNLHKSKITAFQTQTQMEFYCQLLERLRCTLSGPRPTLILVAKTHCTATSRGKRGWLRARREVITLLISNHLNRPARDTVKSFSWSLFYSLIGFNDSIAPVLCHASESLHNISTEL
jgi:hypothetical protein